MSPLLLRFKGIIAQIASRFEVGWILREDRRLTDFLENVAQSDDPPCMLAARAIHFFCVENGQFNGFMPGVLAALQLLKETHGPLDASVTKQAQQDLATIMKAGCTTNILFDWAKSHFDP